MAESIRESLPPVYRHLVSDFFDRPKVVEGRATCDSCVMCDHGQPSPVAMEYFNPDTKCCTFTPNLPNYLVGAILTNTSVAMAEGRQRVRAAIAKRIGVTPCVLSRSRKLTLIMSGYREAFGRAKSLLCPYYDGSNPKGTCSIWLNREAVCMTYYCKYSGGMRGFRYWSALKSYLEYVQRSLARNAVAAIDSKLVEPYFEGNILTVEEIDDLPPKDSDYRKWWGRWVDREEEFYAQCHAWVKSLTAAEFAKHVDGSQGGKRLLDDLVSRYEVLSNKVLPKSLVKNRLMKEIHTGDKIVVTTYHGYDSFSLDKDLYEVVGMFRADQTLEENLERLRQDGIEIVPELVEYLFATGVLVEPPSAKRATKGTSNQAAGAATENPSDGHRAALHAVLEARGLSVDDATQTKIDAADTPTLELWIRKSAIASTIEEAFSDT